MLQIISQVTVLRPMSWWLVFPSDGFISNLELQTSSYAVECSLSCSWQFSVSPSPNCLPTCFLWHLCATPCPLSQIQCGRRLHQVYNYSLHCTKFIDCPKIACMPQEQTECVFANERKMSIVKKGLHHSTLAGHFHMRDTNLTFASAMQSCTWQLTYDV